MVATGKNWGIPYYWGPVIRFISCPILAIITSFAYPSFYTKRMDPLHIFAFTVAHVVMIVIVIGFIIPRSLDIFVPADKRQDGSMAYAPQVTILGVSAGEEAAEAAEGGGGEQRVSEPKE